MKAEPLTLSQANDKKDVRYGIYGILRVFKVRNPLISMVSGLTKYVLRHYTVEFSTFFLICLLFYQQLHFIIIFIIFNIIKKAILL